jgi:tetratricopeptide (TPR) repeat protein
MPTSFVIQLKNQLPEEHWARLLRALRNEPLVWQALQNEEFAQKALKIIGNHIENWSPASLALLALGYPNLLQKLSSNLSITIEEKLLHQAAATLETITSGEPISFEFSLHEAGLLALALRERWRLTRQWDEITSCFHPTLNSYWYPTMACLYRMLPDPHDLLIHLLSSDEKQQLFNLGVHAILSNPIPLEEQCDILINMIIPLPSNRRLDQLRKIFNDHPPLGQMIATQLIEIGKGAFETAESKFDEIQHLLEKSEILKISGQYNLAMPTLTEAMQTSMQMQIDLAAQLAQAAAKDDDKETALQAIEQASIFDSQLVHTQPEITLAKIQTSQLDPTNLKDFNSDDIPFEPINPTTLLANAKLAIQDNDKPKAQLIAQQTLEVSLNLGRSITLETEQEIQTSIISTEFLQTLSETLLELDLPIEGCRAAELALELSQNDPKTLWLLSQSHMTIGDLSKALEFAHITTALSPEIPKYRKTLVDILMANKAWEEAKFELEGMISKLSNPTSEDFRDLAICNLKTNHPKDAAQSCQRMLHINPQDGEAHALLGEAYRHIGDSTSANRHFNQAILHAPHFASPWLELVKFHLDKGEIDKAKERLIAANKVIPECPEVHLALSKIHQQQNNCENALEEIRIAEQFASHSSDVQLKQHIHCQLGNALFNLGHLHEARQILEKAHQAYPSNADLAHIYGKILLASGDIDSSLSTLSIALQNQEPTSEVYLDYGMAKLALGTHPKEALEAIKTGIQLEPDHPTGLALLAEATAQLSKHSEAIAIYQQALETEIIHDHLWYSRLSIGIAKSAIEIKEPEIAIATLKDALQKNPEELGLLKVLCQAYIMANLQQEALKTLVEIFSRSDSSLESLIWVSDQAITLKKTDMALDALNQAALLAPDRPEIIVRLGYIQLETDQPEAARKTFGQLFSSEKVQMSDLKLAAQALINLGDISSSIPYLEKALELSNYQSTDLLDELTTLYERAGDFQAALHTLQKHIELAPNNPELRVKMSQILIKLGRFQLALECILDALEMTPKNANLHMQAAFLFWRNGDLQASLEQIEFAHKLNPNNPQILYLATEINSVCLNTGRVKILLDSGINKLQNNIHWLFLFAENALDYENWEIAEGKVQEIIERANHHPRLSALQARILYSKGDHSSARTVFQETLQNLGNFNLDEIEPYSVANIRFAVAEAAQTLGYWDVAKYLVQQEIIGPIQEARAYLNLAKILTRRAEYQHNCQAVQARNNIPGHTVLNQFARETFNISIQKALDLAITDEAKENIRHWQLRGSYSLHNKLPGKVSLIMNSPEDCAGEIAAYRRAGEFNQLPEINKRIANDPRVLFQLSLGQAKDNPEEAIKTISLAIKQQPNNAFFLALKGFLAKRIGDITSSLTNITYALTLCVEEPRWHALAAELHSELGQYSAAITHLEQASQLEPDHASHFYNLGQANQIIGSPGNAIRALEQAIGLDSSNSKYWFELHNAHKSVNDLEQAGKCADYLIKLNPNQVEPLLIRAKIAFDAKEKSKARSLVNQAAKLNPKGPNELRMLSQVLLELGDIEKAINLLDEAISLSLNPLPLLLERADAMQSLSGKEVKLDTLKALSKDFPEEPSVLAAIVSTHIENHQSEEAIKTAQHALKLNPKRLEIKEQAKLNFQLGALLRQVGQLDQAIHHLNIAIEIAPRFLEAHLEIGEAHYQRREHQQALEYFTQAATIAPNNPVPHKMAGIILKECKDYVGAEVMLRRAVTLAPKDLYIQRQLGAVIALTLIHKPKEADVKQ